MSSSIEVYAWVNTTELLQYLPNLPKYAETPIIKSIHSQFTKDKCCIKCKTNNLIDLSKFQAKIISGHLFITCNDVKELIAIGFVPECMYNFIFEQPKSVQQFSHVAVNVINPFANVVNHYKSPNPYEFHYSSVSFYEEMKKQEEMKKREELKKQEEMKKREEMKKQEEMKKREEMMKRKEAICMRLKSICEDESSILSGLIHMTYMSCVDYYGQDAIHKVPGIIYSDIIKNIIDCGKFMNHIISSISTILNQEISSFLTVIELMEDIESKNYQTIDEIENYRKLMSDCHELFVMWDNIETWIKSNYDDFPKIFDELIPKMFEYIEYIQHFALDFNRTNIKINGEPLSAIGMINNFIADHRK